MMRQPRKHFVVEIKRRRKIKAPGVTSGWLARALKRLENKPKLATRTI
ncbi:hypothetical protein KX729_32000 [Rhizobium sp. XQZ8]|nr:hypothetical protein [Rhizobium populisoli]MBW6426002.1 hypothetical protein [Rhizobium populisoli]